MCRELMSWRWLSRKLTSSRLIRDRGIDALVDECLIGPVFSFGALAVGYLCGLTAYLYLVFTHPAYNKNNEFTVAIVGLSILGGMQICNIFTTPLNSGIVTIFVASAWEPEVMMRDHPGLYERMVAVYPRVQEAIHA